MAYQNLKTRLGTAGALIVGVIGLDILSAVSCFGRYLFFSCALIVVAIAAWEFASLGSRTILRKVTYALVCLVPVLFEALVTISTGLCGVFSLQRIFFLATYGGVAALFCAALVVVSLGRDSLELADKVSRELFLGLLLIGFGGALALGLVLATDGINSSPGLYLIWLLIVVGFNDAGAYFIGSKLKGPKLAPVLSPNKTISGSIGGIVCGTILGVVFAYAFGFGFCLGESALVCIAIVMGSQVGDLAKSYLKRIHGVKDTGNILPGHGGVLDRIDGALGGAPLLYLCLLGCLC